MSSKVRGPYKKGEEKRKEILGVALETFSRLGYYATSMREIAKECGLTQPGLLHHFRTKPELLQAIIADRNDRQTIELKVMEVGWREKVIAIAEDNLKYRTETLLFSMLSAEAEDASHPAHDYMTSRYRQAVEIIAGSIALERGGKTSQSDLSKAHIIVGAWDGLQLQWLMDDSYQMIDDLKLLIESVAPKR